MNLADLEKIFSSLGSRTIKRKPGKQELSLSCPFAPFKAEHKGRDEHPSMKAWITRFGSVRGRCYCCKVEDDLLRLVDMYGDLSGQNVSEIKGFIRTDGRVDILSKLKQIPKTYDEIPNSNRFKPMDFVGVGVSPQDFWSAHAKAKPVESIVVTEEEYAQWSGTVPHYAIKRGISPELANAWELGFANPLIVESKDEYGDTKKVAFGKRLMFAIRDFEGRLVGWSGRALDDWRKPKYLHSKGAKLSLYFYGEHKIDFSVRSAYIVEGFFDTLKLTSFGYRNVLAVMSGSASGFHLEKMIKWFDQVTVVPDGDTAGLALGDQVRKGIDGRIKVLVAGHIPGKDPGDIDNPSIAHRLISEAK